MTGVDRHAFAVLRGPLSRRPDAGRAAALLAVVILVLCPLAGHGAQPWPATRFQAFVGEPFEGGNWQGDLVGTENLDTEETADRPHPRAVADVERAFNEAAAWYRKKGFPPPNIGPVVETENGPAYRIYLCKPRGGGFHCGKNIAAAAAYVPLCGGDTTRTRYIYVNWERSIGNTLGLNELGYQSVAHELMHAIIDNTPFGTPSACGSTGGWITEGLPDAISFDIADEIWVKQNRYRQSTRSEDIIKRYGYRPYLESLPQTGTVPMPAGGDLKATYTSSSFWRYLADSHPDGWGVLLTTRANGTPGLLDIPIRGEAGWRREVQWLDGGLRGKFNRGLQDMYGLFVNRFAYQIAPMESYAGKPAEDNLAHWTTLLFNKCPLVDLGSEPKREVTLQLMGLGSRCIWVESPATPGYIQVTFTAKSEDESLLKDISIGQAGTTLVNRGITAPSPDASGAYVASWRDFPQDGATRTLYVVSNAARDPAKSKRRSVTLAVEKASHSNSAWAGPLPPAAVAPRPSKPDYDKHAKSLTRQTAATGKMMTEQMRLDKESINPNVSGSTDVTRRPNIPQCIDAFKYTACGPQLAISLRLIPGTYAAPGGVNAQGGMAAQGMGGLQAMAQSSLFGAQETGQKIKARLDKIDGSGVYIQIPLIDYGFSGTLDNAAISVDMAGGRTLSAFGPPDRNGNTRLTGRVEISEFTPLFIRGSFSAPLAEFEPASGDRPPIYRRRETVTGTFSSVVPWMSDERTQVVAESAEQLGDDVANSMGISAEMVHRMKREGSFPGSGGSAAGSGSGGGAAISGDCSCDCGFREHADELCELFCEEEFAACASQ
ncbi:MAG: hypothetical protein KDI05_08920 [Halieaceae bacterium]|nr:hypothetical protein [Halieaceae bacterium]